MYEMQISSQIGVSIQVGGGVLNKLFILNNDVGKYYTTDIAAYQPLLLLLVLVF